MKDNIKDTMKDIGLTANEVKEKRKTEKKERDSLISKVASSIPYAREVYHAIKMIDNLITVDR